MVKRLQYAPADPFTVSPLITLLPVCGSIDKLESLTSSLYARFEKVKALQASGQGSGGQKRHVAEATMLRLVLEWLSMQPDTQGEKVK